MLNNILSKINELEGMGNILILPFFLEKIKSGFRETRDAACRGLGTLGGADQRIIDALLLTLDIKKGVIDKWGGDRACQALASLNNSIQAIPSILLRIKSKNLRDRFKACCALEKLGVRAPCVIDALLMATKDKVEGVQRVACRALGKLGVCEPRVIDALLAVMKENDSWESEIACKALGKLKYVDKIIVDCLLTEILDRKSNIRDTACGVLGKLWVSEKRVIDALLVMMKANDDCKNACKALGQLGVKDKSVIDALLKAIESDGYRDVRKNACIALGQLGVKDKSVIDALLRAIQDEDGYVRIAACWALLWGLEVQDKTIIDALFMAIQDADNDVYRGICKSLEKLGQIKVLLDDLLLRIRDENSDFRKQSCQMLGVLGYSENRIIDALMIAINDEDFNVRIQACVALDSLGKADKAILTTLLLITKSENKKVRYAAYFALQELGCMEKRVLESLMLARKDKKWIDDPEEFYMLPCKWFRITMIKLFLNFHEELDTLIKSVEPGENISNKKKLNPARLFTLNSHRFILQTIPGWEINNLPGVGNRFYHVLAAQLKLINHDRLKEIPAGTTSHNALRLDIQQQDFSDSEWTGDEDFEAVVRRYNVVLAIVDTHKPGAGFRCCFVGDDGNYSDVTGDCELPDRPVIKMAYTGNHYMSVISHPALNAGAYRQPSEMDDRTDNIPKNLPQRADQGDENFSKDENIAISKFKGSENSQTDSHLLFKTWYHPDICHWLLQLCENHSKCIRVILPDSGYDDNTQTFNKQLGELKSLSTYLNHPAIFISKEPGADNHFVCGIIHKNDLLFINPLGITSRKKCYEVLHAFQSTQNKFDHIYISNLSIQRKEYEEGLVSCGPISMEIAIYVLSQLTREGLNVFFDERKKMESTIHQGSGLTYTPTSIDSLLPKSCAALPGIDNQSEYETAIRNIRQTHLDDLQTWSRLRAEKNNQTEDGYLNNILDAAPSQVIFNLLMTQEKTILEVGRLPEYNQLLLELGDEVKTAKHSINKNNTTSNVNRLFEHPELNTSAYRQASQAPEVNNNNNNVIAKIN